MVIRFIVEHSSSSCYYHTTHNVAIPNEMFPEEVIKAIKSGNEVDIEFWEKNDSLARFL